MSSSTSNKSNSGGGGEKQKLGGMLLEALRALSPTHRHRLKRPPSPGSNDVNTTITTTTIDDKHSFISPRVREMSDYLRSSSLESQRLLEHSSGSFKFSTTTSPAAAANGGGGEAALSEAGVPPPHHHHHHKECAPLGGVPAKHQSRVEVSNLHSKEPAAAEEQMIAVQQQQQEEHGRDLHHREDATGSHMAAPSPPILHHSSDVAVGQAAATPSGGGGLAKALSRLAVSSERGVLAHTTAAEEGQGASSSSSGSSMVKMKEAALMSSLEQDLHCLAVDDSDILPDHHQHHHANDDCTSPTLQDDEVTGGEAVSFKSDGGFYCSPRPRLILHVDINKTILIRDQAQDAGSDSMVNVLLSECAWGRMMPGPKWIPVGRLATDRPAADPDLMTYRAFLDGFLLPFERGFGKDIDKMNDEIKSKRQALKRRFTSPGEPGEMFYGVYKQLMSALQVPEEKGEAMRTAGVGDGKEIVLLPSFFELLKHLQARERNFSIIFRTFGTDAVEIINELNLFCSGQHPLHPEVRMDGSDGKTDLRLQLGEERCCGCFYRHGLGSDGTLLAMGVPKQVMSARVIGPHNLEPIADSLTFHRNFHDIYHALQLRCCSSSPTDASNTALALRDYYPWWKSHQERAKTGKLMVIDRGDYSVHQIFLDDNVGFGSPHIVDVRDVDTGDPVPFSESIGKYLVKVEPLNAILDSQYFIRAVRRCEEERNATHYAALSRSQSQPLLVKPSKWRNARIGVLSVVRLASNR